MAIMDGVRMRGEGGGGGGGKGEEGRGGGGGGDVCSTLPLSLLFFVFPPLHSLLPLSSLSLSSFPPSSPLLPLPPSPSSPFPSLSSSSSLHPPSHVGDSLPVLLENVNCDGSETDLSQCTPLNWNSVSSECNDHTKDAGVVCTDGWSLRYMVVSLDTLPPIFFAIPSSLPLLPLPPSLPPSLPLSLIPPSLPLPPSFLPPSLPPSLPLLRSSPLPPCRLCCEIGGW